MAGTRWSALMHSAMFIILTFHVNGLPQSYRKLYLQTIFETVISFQVELIISLESFFLRFKVEGSSPGSGGGGGGLTKV